jgi:hypothetical protein
MGTGSNPILANGRISEEAIMPVNEATLSPGVFWTLLVGSAVLSGVGDIFVFQWARQTGWWRLAAGIGLWAISLVLLGLIFRYGSARFSLIIVLLMIIHVVLDMGWDLAVLGTRFNKGEWAGTGWPSRRSCCFNSVGGQATPFRRMH